ncbi:RiPP maturation radical SAM C-methyltransferase [Paraburkholderia sp. EG285A]|uniref:RiPP maturation radical SAM C-methyltransferase n=1 Tax=Paraburkholderia sp. EG285A TaxID=3237009 RepID=UPI0034D308C6
MCVTRWARRPRLVGVSSMFQQHCAALALLRHLKEAAPDVVTLIGGANCEDQMGLATWRNFPFIDYVVSGEADELLPRLIENALQYGATTPPALLPIGVLGRGAAANAAAPSGIGRARVEQLDGSPIPDYGDYFRRLSNSPLRAQVHPGIPIETARGCWWGAVRHCTFCGLNGGSMAFRAKSPGRAILEFATLAERHGIHRFMVVDNIIDLDYFKTVLPRLRDNRMSDWQIFYETKANLRRDQVTLARDAGVAWIQPGIESLNDNLLKQMAKGTTALINTRLLKWAREDGVFVSWNILFDIRQENDDDYRAMAELIPALAHLQPPQAMVRVRVERFSPYQKIPDFYGLTIAPAWPYRYLYPLAEEDLAELCYNFDTLGKARLQTTGDSIPGASSPIAPNSGIGRCHQAVSTWRRLHDAAATPLLCLTPRADGGATVLDTRPCARQRVSHLSVSSTEILALCDQGATKAQLAACPPTPDEWDALIANRWLVLLGDKYLSLPVRGEVPRLPSRRHFPGGYFTTAHECSGLAFTQ